MGEAYSMFIGNGKGRHHWSYGRQTAYLIIIVKGAYPETSMVTREAFLCLYNGLSY